MSDDLLGGSGGTSRPGGAGLPLLLALVLANVLARDPLESLRPEAERLPWTPAGQSERVTSRLWEDPLAVGYEAYARSRGGGGADDALVDAEELKRQVEQARLRAPVTVVPVLVSGGSWVESRETRLRSRYAVVFGLADRDFQPVDDQHLGVCVVDAGDPDRSSMVVPFEWFEHRDTDPDPDTDTDTDTDTGAHALVLWIDDPALGPHPLIQLELLLRRIVPAASSDGESSGGAVRPGEAVELRGEGAGVRVAIVGPATSTTLDRMGRDDLLLGELNGSFGDDPEPAYRWPLSFLPLLRLGEGPLRLAGARLLSTWSTVPPEQLPGLEHLLPVEEDDPDEEGERKEKRSVSPRWRTGLQFLRYVGTDELLVELLLEEIQLRVPTLAEPEREPTWLEQFLGGTGMLRLRERPARILIVAEADTDYGRSFQQVFLGPEDAVGPDEAGPIEVSELLYLRGVDGKVPGERARDAEREGALHPEDAATGQGQHDYLRRIERWMAEAEEHFDAVGVLGSDVYDKLAILEVVRSNFPDAVVFTTDLDARLLPTRESPEALNLVVASHHGLSVGRGEEAVDELFERISFRSTYQLAICLAARDAVADPQAWGEGSEDRARWATRAAVYEIGRDGPLLLASVGDGEQDSDTEGRADDEERDGIPGLATGSVGGGEEVAPSDGEGAPTGDDGSGPYAKLLPFAVLGGLVLLTLRTLRRRRAAPAMRPDPSQALRGGVAAVLVVGLAWRWTTFTARASEGKSASILELTEMADELRGVGVVLLLVAFLLLLLHPVRRTAIGALGGALKWLGPYGAMVAGAALLWGCLELGDFIRAELARDTGEPFALFDGVSIWPTEILRAVVVVYCGLAVVRCVSEVAHSHDAIGRELLDLEPRPRRELRARLGRSGLFAGKDDDSRQSVRELWLDYRAEGLLWSRIGRVVLCCILYYLLTGLMFRYFGAPGVPARGWEAYVADRFLLWLSVTASITLIFVVVDSILSAAKFLRRLKAAGAAAWTEDLRGEHAKTYGLPGGDVAEIVGVRLAERVTAVVGEFLYYPAVALFLLVFSRTRLFDNWTWSVALVLTFLLGFGLLLLTARCVGSIAKEIKDDSLSRLESARVRACRDAGRKSELEAAAGVVSRIRGGAFARLRDHPLVRVLLLPFAGLGAASLLEFFFPLWMQL